MQNKSLINYYIYLRKSSEGEDRQVQSIERQSDEVHSLIIRYGLKIVGTFEESRSAMTPNNRPEFTKMIKGIKAGKANGIICWHINRLSRNPLESGIVQQLLEDGAITSIITKDREYTSADNAIIFSVESSLATQYSKDLGKMVKSGMDKKANEGIAPIRSPLGYLNTKMAEHGSNYIVKDTKRFYIVRHIWELMLTGEYVPSKILAIITKEKGLTPKPNKKSQRGVLTINGVYDILTNPFYTGYFLYKNKLYKGKHEAMITMAEFERIQIMLGRKGNARYQKHHFAYRGLMTCGECGCAITATRKTKLIKSTGLEKSYVYYYCTNRKADIDCKSRVPIKEEELEEQILNEIESISITKNFGMLAINIIKQQSEQLKNECESIEISQHKAIEKLRKEISNLLQMRIADNITDEEYKFEKLEREKAIIVLEQNNRELQKSPYYLLNKIEEALSTIQDIKSNFITSSENHKKKLLLTIGENFQLIGKKLSIIKPKWLQVIEKYKKGVEAEIAWLELQEYVDITAFSKHFNDMFPLMCTLAEEVGTEVNNEIDDFGNS